MNITYIKGDATSPQAKGLKLIVYICNDRGGWGKFVVAISAAAEGIMAEHTYSIYPC
jgi:hypothetical protein